MKEILMCLVVLCLFIGLSFADSMQAKHIINDLRQERQMLEKQRKLYDKRLRTLIRQRREVEKNYQVCISFKGHDLDELTLKVDDERKLLEEEWNKFITHKKSLEAKNQSLELYRRNIERQFKGKARGKPYDDKISKYAELFRKEYIQPYKDLLSEYKHYILGMNSYFEAVRELTAICRKKKSVNSGNSSKIDSKIDTMKSSTDEIFLLNREQKLLQTDDQKENLWQEEKVTPNH